MITAWTRPARIPPSAPAVGRGGRPAGRGTGARVTAVNTGAGAGGTEARRVSASAVRESSLTLADGVCVLVAGIHDGAGAAARVGGGGTGVGTGATRGAGVAIGGGGTGVTTAATGAGRGG